MKFQVPVFRFLISFFSRYKRFLLFFLLAIVALHFLLLAAGKIYQHWDDDPDRGAIGIENGAFGESYSTPVYLKEQGWSESDSLWFYNVTQGSALLPYDLYLRLELENSNELIRSNAVIDRFRYLPQKKTFFNPDALAVGIVKDTYQGMDYMGFSCAACHTAQVNYMGKAIRIDGGPAMADMVGYLHAMEKGMKQTLSDAAKNKRFVDAVIALGNDYSSAPKVNQDLKKWTETIELYNTVNHSHIKYGYARLDAFGRIYNRVLQYVPNRSDIFDILTQTLSATGQFLISYDEANLVLDGIDETIIGNDQFIVILKRLASTDAGYPALSQRELLRIRNALFNEANAPVSYPFLWDIAQSDYVQWNGIAENSGLGPLGRNTGEVIGVFGILDWSAKEPGFSLSSFITKQNRKKKRVDFKSSIDLTNLARIERHLASLKSPPWPEALLGVIDQEKARNGKKIYGQYCQSCHELLDRDDDDRIVIGKFSAVDTIGTDPAMAANGIKYKGKSGNFKHTYQSTSVGDVILAGEAPVAQILTSVTKGVVTSRDPDKGIFRRWGDWLYTIGASLFDNPIQGGSVKAGNYTPNTTANPYNSLYAYKARSLNGIWATAPYLHNGSVPTLYDLLLPKKQEGDSEEGEYRPDSFKVGSREFDPVKVGFRSEGYEGHKFTTFRVGDLNVGHEYAAGKTAQIDGTIKPALNTHQRWDLLEYLKTL